MFCNTLFVILRPWFLSFYVLCNCELPTEYRSVWYFVTQLSQKAKSVTRFWRNDFTGGAEKAGVKNAGAKTYGKPSKQKTVRYQEYMLKRSGLRRSLNSDLVYTSRQCVDSRFELLWHRVTLASRWCRAVGCMTLRTTSLKSELTLRTTGEGCHGCGRVNSV